MPEALDRPGTSVEGPVQGAGSPAGDGDGSERPQRSRDGSVAALVLALALFAGVVLRLASALGTDGLYHPAEVYASLEPAHRLAFGYGLDGWAVSGGPKGWALPAMLAALLKVCAWLGLESPRAYGAIVRLLLAMSGAMTAVWGASLARKYQAGWLSACLSGSFVALMSLAIYFSGRALAEAVAPMPLLLGYVLALEPSASRSRLRAGSLAVGAAAVLWPLAVLPALGLCCLLLWRRLPRAAVESVVLVALVVAAAGLFDRLILGSWFHSLALELKVPVPTRAALAAAAAFYARHLLASLGPLALVLAGFSVLGAARAPGLFLVTLVTAAAPLLRPERDVRFLFPALVLACVVSGLSVDVFWRVQLPSLSRATVLLGLVAAIGSAAYSKRMTYGDLGRLGLPPGLRAADEGGPENRLLVSASERSDLCGLKVASRGLESTGGYFLLHKDVNLYPPDGPELASRRYNYVIARSLDVEGEQVGEDQGLVLVRVSQAGCEKDPAYERRLR